MGGRCVRGRAGLPVGVTHGGPDTSRAGPGPNPARTIRGIRPVSFCGAFLLGTRWHTYESRASFCWPFGGPVVTLAVSRAARQRAAGRFRAAWQHGPLANRSFRFLAAGQFTSATGDSCYAVALPWLTLTEHGNAVLLGMVLACYGLPRTALIPVGGQLSDRVGARTLMLVADATRCVLVGVLAVVALRHQATLLALGPVAALTGASEGLFIPPSYALVPSLLPPAQLQAGNAIASAAAEGGNLIGPALGGPLGALARPARPFAAGAASFAVSAASLALIPDREAGGRLERLRQRGGRADRAVQADGGDERLWPLVRRERLLQ